MQAGGIQIPSLKGTSFLCVLPLYISSSFLPHFADEMTLPQTEMLAAYYSLQLNLFCTEKNVLTRAKSQVLHQVISRPPDCCAKFFYCIKKHGRRSWQKRSKSFFQCIKLHRDSIIILFLDSVGLNKPFSSLRCNCGSNNVPLSLLTRIISALKGTGA